MQQSYGVREVGDRGELMPSWQERFSGYLPILPWMWWVENSGISCWLNVRFRPHVDPKIRWRSPWRNRKISVWSIAMMKVEIVRLRWTEGQLVIFVWIAGFWWLMRIVLLTMFWRRRLCRRINSRQRHPGSFEHEHEHYSVWVWMWMS